MFSDPEVLIPLFKKDDDKIMSSLSVCVNFL